MRELLLRKCPKCDALVKVINDNCHLTCCGEEMVVVTSNSTDAAFEKHVPNYIKKDKDLIVTVDHVMESDHYIEWLAFISDNKEEFVYLKPGIKAEVTFKDATNGYLYSYCNKHGLWEKEVI